MPPGRPAADAGEVRAGNTEQAVTTVCGWLKAWESLRFSVGESMPEPWATLTPQHREVAQRRGVSRRLPEEPLVIGRKTGNAGSHDAQRSKTARTKVLWMIGTWIYGG